MCITADFTKPTITTEPIIAYKVVRPRADGTVGSEFAPQQRSYDGRFKTYGKARQYTIDNKSQSTFRSTPGLFCYRDLRIARREAWRCHALLQVRIPAGTKIVEGTTRYSQEVICCERLVVESFAVERVL